MLSNAYFLAKFRFDTAENEPAKNLQNFAEFANFADPNPKRTSSTRAPAHPLAESPGGRTGTSAARCVRSHRTPWRKHWAQI